MDTLRFYCVLQGDAKMEEDEELESCAKHIKDLKWIKEEECLSYDTESLSKDDVFVFQKFSGRAFEHLSTKSKALVIGSMCLKYCLTEKCMPIEGPMFNVAMLDMTVCSSGIPKPSKNEIKRLVVWMGGYFRDNLDASCTHLVTNTVRSEKYEKAALNGLEILHPDWVNDVWKRNQAETILANDPIFAKHRLQIFTNITFSSTNLRETAEKDKIIKLIEDNGGKYLKTFHTKHVNILILRQDGIFSDKYKLSAKYKIECLSPEWIYESVKKNYAVPTKDYRVVSMKSKSDNMDQEDEEKENIQVRANTSLAMTYKGVKTPVRRALLALDTPKKTPDTPITAHIKKNYPECETPIRNLLRETKKMNVNIDEYRNPDGTVRTPAIPEGCKMPPSPLDRNPDATPGSQWSLLRNAEVCDSLHIPITVDNKKSPRRSEICRELYKSMLGVDKYNSILSSQSETQGHDVESQPKVDTAQAPDSMRKFQEFLERKKVQQTPPPASSTTQRRLDLFPDNPEPFNDSPRARLQMSEKLVDWVDPSEYQPIRNPADHPPKEYNFHLAGVAKTRRKEVIEKIESLGGKVLLTSTYDFSCSHIVFENLNRGEKVLCAVASGKWIVPMNYIEDSLKVGHFLSEKDYEVGNDQLLYYAKLSEKERVVAKAAYRWRRKINGDLPGEEESAEGALCGMKFLLLLSDQQSDRAGRIIQAGKGTVLYLKPPFCRKTDAKSIMYVIINTKREKLSRVDQDFFSENGAHVVTIKFLNALLCNATLPDPRDFYP